MFSIFTCNLYRFYFSTSYRFTFSRKPFIMFVKLLEMTFRANFGVSSVFSPEFPALTGTLALAMFMHNAVLSIMRNQEKPENNVRSMKMC